MQNTCTWSRSCLGFNLLSVIRFSSTYSCFVFLVISEDSISCHHLPFNFHIFVPDLGQEECECERIKNIIFVRGCLRGNVGVLFEGWCKKRIVLPFNIPS